MERSSKPVEPSTDDADSELEEKVSRILEMFPQLTRTQLLDVSLLHQPHLYNFCLAIINIVYIFRSFRAQPHWKVL